jgi:hypothetical protein
MFCWMPVFTAFESMTHIDCGVVIYDIVPPCAWFVILPPSLTSLNVGTGFSSRMVLVYKITQRHVVADSSHNFTRPNTRGQQ